MKKIILASTSPRRIELMQNLGLVFDPISPVYEENMMGLTFSYDAIENIALCKAKSIVDIVTEPSLIISADTVVVVGDEVWGKPKDYSEAFEMLSKLSNLEHKVVTSIAILDSVTKEGIIESTTSIVTFTDLSQEKIDWYINNFKPFDKAGSYGIQELPDDFVKQISGDFDNIIGLPTKTLIKMLKKIRN